MFDTSQIFKVLTLSNTRPIRGSVFFLSDLSYTNFENADFSTDNWEEAISDTFPYGEDDSTTT